VTIGLSRVSSVVVFCLDWIAAAHWWARMTGTPVQRMPRSASLVFDGVELVFVPPDERNPAGGSPLPYWRVEDFDGTRAELAEWGCVELHRPVGTPGRNRITQFADPFGTTFGIEGPWPEGTPVWPEVTAEMTALRAAYARGEDEP
jgi:hypothetical protein